MSNRLANASSPYLRQHADNPVDWYPWGEEALSAARESSRPILLSVGYAACHWCHVMAHESFESEETAKLMNQWFINIKVDREERPDLDKIYQTAQMLLSQRSGGWPLTLFLTHDKRIPFFGGTYFPPEPRHGMPAFSHILERVASWYAEHAEDLNEQNESVCAALGNIYQAPESAQWPISIASQTVEAMAQSFDEREGGFGGAPKFPRPTQLQWLLSQDNPRAQHMATHTLLKMAEGGLHDHVGGGFYRYSVDAHWMIPHFEKMLYDQALLLPLYARAAAQTSSAQLKVAAEGIVSFVTRELQDPNGGFYSSLDADSEGEEGKFYVWTPEEVKELVDPEHFDAFTFRFGLDRAANFEGNWHLHGFRSLTETAARTNQPTEDLQENLALALQKLLQARGKRIRPGLDDKMLTSWNALMIRALVLASRFMNTPDWLQPAESAFAFLRENLWADTRLQASFSQGQAHFNAYLDDYAFALEAALLLLQTRWRREDLEFATQLADVIATQFAGPNGEMFFTTEDHEDLLVRPQLLADDVTPAGCAIACESLSRLGHLLGRGDWIDLAQRTLRYASGAIIRGPSEHARFLETHQALENPLELIILRGAKDDMAAWKQQATDAGHDDCYAIPAEETDLPEGLTEKTPGDGVIAYVCTGLSCEMPIQSLDTFGERLAPQ